MHLLHCIMVKMQKKDIIAEHVGTLNLNQILALQQQHQQQQHHIQ